MPTINCANHPEREAVMSIATRYLPLGRRPLILNMIAEAGGLFYDLCEECVANLELILKKEETNASA